MSPEVRTILKLRVPVIVQIGSRQMPLEHVLSLGPGAILELGKPADEELELLVNNKRVGSGHAVKVGENFGIKIAELGTPAQRVAALGA